MRKWVKFLLVIGSILCLLYIYARFINPNGFKVNEYSIVDNDIPDSFNGIKIIHFSDIHFGRTTNMETLKKVVNEINILKPDIVVYTGDLYEKNIKINKNDEEKIITELNKIEVTIGKYAITGNSDSKNYKKIMNKSNFNLIDDNSELVYYNGTTPIKLTNNYENIDEFFTIGLIHKPDDIDNMNLDNINIVLAGHSLHGQIRIPFYGAVLKRNGAKKYTDSYYDINNTKLFVSNGLGTENFSFRMFNKPSINLYRLSNY